MSRFVLDNTVTMSWCFADEASALSQAILTRLANLIDTAIAPALWLYEVANVVELAARKGRIPEDQAKLFLMTLNDLPIEVENPTRTQVFEEIRALATQYKLTAYDASYLELALRYKHPIATFDKALAKAALAAGVEVVSQ